MDAATTFRSAVTCIFASSAQSVKINSRASSPRLLRIADSRTSRWLFDRFERDWHHRS